MGRQRIRSALIAVAASGVLVAGSPAAHSAGDPVAGKEAYEGTCGGCHSLDANRVGPMHRGVVGRQPGAASGYNYSNAVRKLGGVWTVERLDQWLQGPQAVAPGARLFLSVPDAGKRADIIAYLASVSPPAKPAEDTKNQ